MKKGSQAWLSAGLITLVTVLTYGVLIPWLGFYRDDWYLLWAAQAQGSDGIVGLFQSDRPLIGYLYALDYSLLGASPLGWHLYALALRLTGNLAFLWLARQIWPGRRAESTTLALLFAVYPGFTSQPNAGVFVNLLLANAAALLSFALTATAIHSERGLTRTVCTVLAALLALFYLAVFEAMIGLEVARLVMLWYLLWRRRPSGRRALLRRTAKWSVPYLIVAGAFAYWRLFVFQSTRHSTNLGLLLLGFNAMPLKAMASILLETLKDAVETSFFAWIVPFYRFTATANYRDLVYASCLALIVAAPVWLYLRRSGEGEASGGVPEARAYLHTALLGICIVIAALLPFNAAGRNVLFDAQWDRYALPGALGVALLLGGLIFHVFDQRARSVIVIVLVAMSVVVHFFSAAWYRDFWSSTRQLWWQVIWRAPSLQRGTMLFVPVSEYAEGYEIYGPANIIYYPGEPELQIGAEVLNSETGAYLMAQRDLEHLDRSVAVPDNYDRALIAIFPTADSCLHILDGRLVDLPGLIDGSLVSSAAPYSRIEQIEVSGAPPSAPAFLGEEPAHGWCYYYQQIKRARDDENWPEVARLMDEAQSRDLQPRDFSEWLPALEAYAALGRIQDARHAAAIIRVHPPTRFFLCAELRKRIVYAPPYDHQTVQDLICDEAG